MTRPGQARKRLRSYRSARLGSAFLAVISWIVLPLFFATDEMDDPGMMAATYASAVFWPAMAYICHLKIRLIRMESEADL